MSIARESSAVHPSNREVDLRDRLLDDGFFAPTYRDFGVANVPDTVAQILGAEADRPLPEAAVGHPVERSGDPIEHVVAVIVDGFGWNRYRDLLDEVRPLTALAERATVTPLTSTYPSETAAAMITLYTGLQPVEHGQLGWFAWYPTANRVGLSLPFETRDGRPLDEALGLGPDALFDPAVRDPLAARLESAGVTSRFVQPASLAHSPASRHVARGADLVGFETLRDGFDVVRSNLEGASGSTYHLVYYPDVDAAAHLEGSRSDAYRDALRSGLAALYSFLDDLDDGVAERTLLLVLADHGIHDTGPAVDVALDRLEAEGAVDLEAHLRHDADGERLYLAGSPRNLQLYAKDGHVDALASELSSALDARIFDRAAYCEADLFGDRDPGPAFEARAPDLVVVPAEGGLWYDDGELDVIGMHGGMHPHEMLVPLFALRGA